MDEIKQMAKTVAQCIKGDSKKTKGYDTAATVKRVDGGTLYVSIPGGVPETPVKKTIDAKVGDTVQVHVGNGTAWLTGNRTAPPTDDAEALVAKAVAKVADKAATKAKTTAEQAQKTANGIKQHFWTDDDGAHITEVTQAEYEDDPDNAGGNLLAQASSVSVREGTKDLAVMSKDGFDAKTYDSSDNEVVIAHLGYGAGADSGGGTSKAPYYDLGVRLSGSTKGNYSIVEGSANTASGYDAHAEGNVTTASGTGSHCEGSFTTASGSYTHCEGWRTTASGYISHAGGRGTIADQPYQTAIGKYNTDNNTDNLFVVGNGTGDNARSDAFTVDNSGNVTAAGGIRSPLETPTPSITATKGTLVATQARRFGQVVQLWIQYRNTSSTAGGQNVFEGTLNTTALRPTMSSSGAGYFGEHAMVGFLTTAGDITIRNASSTAITIPSTSTSSVAITYLVE